MKPTSGLWKDLGIFWIQGFSLLAPFLELTVLNESHPILKKCCCCHFLVPVWRFHSYLVVGSRGCVRTSDRGPCLTQLLLISTFCLPMKTIFRKHSHLTFMKEQTRDFCHKRDRSLQLCICKMDFSLFLISYFSIKPIVKGFTEALLMGEPCVITLACVWNCCKVECACSVFWFFKSEAKRS